MKIIHERNHDRIILVIASIALQSVLGLFLGHHYDLAVFFTAGYAVANGMAPYGTFQARSIFDSSSLIEELTGIGYPPPWALYLGLVYSIVYLPTRNLFAYNLGIKLPSIIANVALAFFVERYAAQIGVGKENCRRIFYLLLFNPFIIYISSIWGQFDSIVILTNLLALGDLYHRRILRSSLLMALSVSLKILPIVLVPLFLAKVGRNSNLTSSMRFLLLFSLSSVALSYLPFAFLGWGPDIILRNFDVHFIRAGCFTLFNILDFLYGSTTLPLNLEILGYLWIPALILGYYLLSKTPLKSLRDLFRWSSSIIFILMLTRSWVSEQNIVLLIPLAILATAGSENKSFIRLIWVIPMIFSFLNTSPFQMFFLISPEPLNFVRKLDDTFKLQRLFLKFIVVIPWQVLGWLYVKRALRQAE